MFETNRLLNMSNMENIDAWKDAVKQFHFNPNAQVFCPECKKSYLKIKDEIWPDGSKMDRYLYCEECKSWNVATISID
jgi:hypothetical protein